MLICQSDGCDCCAKHIIFKIWYNGLQGQFEIFLSSRLFLYSILVVLTGQGREEGSVYIDPC